MMLANHGIISIPKTPIPGLWQWLDAADMSTITQVSGAVSAWADKSGNARNVTQATGSRQPSLGAWKGMLFDDDFFQAASHQALGGNAYLQIYVCLKIQNTTSDQRILSVQQSTTTRLGVALNVTAGGGGAGYVMCTCNSGGYTPSALNTGGFSSGQVATIGLRKNNTTLNSFIGNTFGPSVASNSSTGSGAVIGAGSAAAGQVFAGYMYEILIYTRVLTSDEHLHNLAYLGAKWA